MEFVETSDEENRIYGDQSYLGKYGTADGKMDIHSDRNSDRASVRDFEIMEVEGETTRMAAFINLFNCAVGAGVLSLPNAFQNLGLILAILVFSVMSVSALYSLNVLIECSIQTGQKSYDQLVRHVLGNTMAVVFKVIVVLYCFGVCTGYVIIIGDLLPEILQTWAGVDDYNSPPFYLSKIFLQMIIIIFIISPLCSFSSIDSLKYASAFAVFAVMYFTLVVLIRSFQYIGSDEFEASRAQYFNWGAAIFSGIPIIAFALGGHVQSISVYQELQPGKRNRTDWLKVSGGMIASLSLVYLLVSVFSYYRYLPDDGNILEAMLVYDPSDVLVQVSSLMMTVVVVLSYPLMAWPMRQSFEQLVFDPVQPIRAVWKIAITSILIFLTFLIAVLVDNLDVVFGLTGSTGATLVKFIIPGWIYIMLHRQGVVSLTVAQQLPAYMLVIGGVLIGTASTFVIIYEAFAGSLEDDNFS